MTTETRNTLADLVGITAIVIIGAVFGFLLCYAIFVW